MRATLLAIVIVLLLNACGHRTMLTLPNAKGKPPPAERGELGEPGETERR